MASNRQGQIRLTDSGSLKPKAEKEGDMIVLKLDRETAGTVYFDIHHLHLRQERDQARYVASGTLGDGWYEGEIAVTLGDPWQVTFADEWLDWEALQEFFSRVAREEVCAALAATLDGARLCIAADDGPAVSIGNPSGRAAGERERNPDRFSRQNCRQTGFSGVASGEAGWPAVA
jgi:hypothetical protein